MLNNMILYIRKKQSAKEKIMIREINLETMIEEIQNIKEDILINGNGAEHLVVASGEMKAKIDLEAFEIIAKIRRFSNDIAEAEIEAKDGNISKKYGKWEVKVNSKINSIAKDLNYIIWILSEYRNIKINFENAEIEFKNSKIVRLFFKFDTGAVYCFTETEEINVSGTSFEISGSISRRVSGTVEQAKKQLEKETAISYTEPLTMFRETLIQKINYSKE